MILEIISLIIIIFVFFLVWSINTKQDSLARSLKKINERLDKLESKNKIK
jgi:hypothetical protein